MEKVLEIPRITNTTLQYFVDSEFVDNVTVDEVNKIRENVLMHIVDTKDASILNRFYFVGHKDTNDKIGEEIKITMDTFGNLSDLPWEMCHVRRSMMHLMKIGREHTELLSNFEKISMNCVVIIDELTSLPYCIIKSKKTLSDETLKEYAKQWIHEHNDNCPWSNYYYHVMNVNDAPKLKNTYYV